MNTEKHIHHNKFVDIFEKESDRAAAILAASYLENLLKEFLIKHMVDDKVSGDLFSGQGALATFSSRISICYSFKLIRFETYRDLELIRKIRNHFAHNMYDATFSDSEARSRCDNFEFIKELKKHWDYSNHTSREIFLLAVSFIAMIINENKIWTEI